jgi:hypothetical protein
VTSFTKCHHSIHHHLCKKLFLTPTSFKLDMVAAHFSSNFIFSKLFPSVLIASSHTLFTNNLLLCGMHVVCAANRQHLPHTVLHPTKNSQVKNTTVECRVHHVEELHDSSTIIGVGGGSGVFFFIMNDLVHYSGSQSGERCIHYCKTCIHVSHGLPSDVSIPSFNRII